MTPERYCRALAAPPGSDLRLALLATPRAARALVCALLALREELVRSAEIGDPAVRAARVQWWRDELQRMHDGGQPEHPVSRALQPALARHELAIEPVLEMLDGAATPQQEVAFADRRGLDLFAQRLGGAPWTLIAQALGYREHRSAHYAAESGRALWLLRCLQDTLPAARAGRCLIPLDALREHAVAPETLAARGEDEASSALFASAAAQVRETLGRARAELAARDRRPLAPLLVLDTLALALLDEIAADGHRLLLHRVQLAPLHRRWVALRAWQRARYR